MVQQLEFSLVFKGENASLKTAANQAKEDIAAVGASADKATASLKQHTAAMAADASATLEASRTYQQYQRDALEAAQAARTAAATASLSMPAGSNPQLPNVPRSQNDNRSSGSNHAATNAMYQFQDILMTAAGGMSPAMIGLQQGSQLAGGFAGMSLKDAATATKGALIGLVSPLSIAAIGFTTATAAAIQFGTGLLTAGDETEKLGDALTRHEKVLQAVEQRYGSLIDKAKGFGSESSRILQFEASSDIRGLRNATNAAGKELFDSVKVSFLTMMTDPMSMLPTGAFSDAILKLQNQTREGKPDFDAFYESLYKIAAIDPQYAKKADELTKLVDQFRQGTKALEEMERVRRRLFDTMGQNGMLLSQGTANREDMGNLALFESQQRVSAERNRQALEAQLYAIGARSPQEQAEAARRAAATRYDTSETAPAREQRIEEAGTLALAQAEKQLSEAQRDRLSSLNASLESQKLELSLIGQTTGETQRLRMEHQLTAQVKQEAARRGVEADETELALIKQKSAEYGRMAEQIAATNALRGQSDEIAKLRVEAATIGMSDDTRRRALATFEAEQKIRQLGLNTSSAEAQKYREQAIAISEMQSSVKRATDAWGEFQSAGENAIGAIVDNLGNGDLKGALSGVLSAVKGYLQDDLKHTLSNALLGTSYGTSADLGGIGGIFGKMFGGTGSAFTAPMSVGADTVCIQF